MPKSMTIGLAIMKENVFRLDIAVNHALAMRVVERRGDVGCDTNRVV